jgi:hypothetical protein
MAQGDISNAPPGTADMLLAPLSTVTKAGRFYIVEGEITVIAGRIEREPYSRGHRTHRAALADAIHLDTINAEALASLAAAQADRLAHVRAYLARRAIREAAAPVQFALAL